VSSLLRFPGQARMINLCNNLIPRLLAAAENIKIDKLVTVIVQDTEQFGTPDRKLEAVKASLRPAWRNLRDFKEEGLYPRGHRGLKPWRNRLRESLPKEVPRSVNPPVKPGRARRDWPEFTASGPVKFAWPMQICIRVSRNLFRGGKCNIANLNISDNAT